MKKGWKIFGIICAVMTGVGVLLCIAGFAIGISLEEVSDVFRNGVGIHPYTHETEVRVERIDGEKKESVFDGIRNIDLEVGSVQVEVVVTDEEVVRVEHHVPEKLRFDCYQKGDTLKIETQSKRGNIDNGGNICIYLPSKLMLGEADFSIGAGTLKMTDFKANELSVACGAAAVHLVNVEANDVEIECGAGQIEYAAVGRETDYNYQLEIGAGEVSIGNNLFSGLAVDKKINHGANKNMSIECGAGKVTVAFEQ